MSASPSRSKSLTFAHAAPLPLMWVLQDPVPLNTGSLGRTIRVTPTRPRERRVTSGGATVLVSMYRQSSESATPPLSLGGPAESESIAEHRSNLLDCRYKHIYETIVIPGIPNANFFGCALPKQIFTWKIDCSTVSLVTKRYTWHTLDCPSRQIRDMACLSTAGFQSQSSIMRRCPPTLQTQQRASMTC